jgi:hypothetical protein
MTDKIWESESLILPPIATMTKNRAISKNGK